MKTVFQLNISGASKPKLEFNGHGLPPLSGPPLKLEFGAV